jgi:ABC-type multidrug transport system permease subunit
MEDVGIFDGLWISFTAIFCGQNIWVLLMVIWYIFPVLVCCAMKNLVTLEMIKGSFKKAVFIRLPE